MFLVLFFNGIHVDMLKLPTVFVLANLTSQELATSSLNFC